MSHPDPDDRAAAITWARSVVNDPNVVYLDTETTGLDTTAEVLELAIIDADGRLLVNRRFKPARPIPMAASFVHHIFDRDVARCRRFADCWPEITRLLFGRRVIIWHAAFDVRLIAQSLRPLPGLDPHQTECAMEAYAAWYGDWSPYHGNYKYKTLTFAAAATGDAPTHAALGDARACRAVVRRLANEEI